MKKILAMLLAAVMLGLSVSAVVAENGDTLPTLANTSQLTVTEDGYVTGIGTNATAEELVRNFNNRAAYICTDPSKYADDTSTNYTAAGLSLPSSGNIKTLGNCTALPWAFIPTGTGGSGTTYVPDYVYSYSGWCVLCVGGYYRNDAANCGLFFFNGYCNSSSADSNFGARLLYVP